MRYILQGKPRLIGLRYRGEIVGIASGKDKFVFVFDKPFAEVFVLCDFFTRDKFDIFVEGGTRYRGKRNTTGEERYSRNRVGWVLNIKIDKYYMPSKSRILWKRL